MMWTCVGFAAAFLTMFGFLPQIIKMFHSKSAKDVSFITLVQFSLGVTLWIFYGIHLKDKIIIFANSVTLLSLVIAIILYLSYNKSINRNTCP